MTAPGGSAVVRPRACSAGGGSRGADRRGGERDGPLTAGDWAPPTAMSDGRRVVAYEDAHERYRILLRQRRTAVFDSLVARERRADRVGDVHDDEVGAQMCRRRGRSTRRS